MSNEPSAVLALAAAALAGVLTIFFMCCRSKEKRRAGNEGKKSRATAGRRRAAAETVRDRARESVGEGLSLAKVWARPLRQVSTARHADATHASDSARWRAPRGGRTAADRLMRRAARARLCRRVSGQRCLFDTFASGAQQDREEFQAQRTAQGRACAGACARHRRLCDRLTEGARVNARWVCDVAGQWRVRQTMCVFSATASAQPTS
jgi:hypothetical protein